MSLSYVFFDNLLISRYWEQYYTVARMNEYSTVFPTLPTIELSKKIVKHYMECRISDSNINFQKVGNTEWVKHYSFFE